MSHKQLHTYDMPIYYNVLLTTMYKYLIIKMSQVYAALLRYTRKNFTIYVAHKNG